MNRWLKIALGLIGLLQIGYGLYVPIGEIRSPQSAWESNLAKAGRTEKVLPEFKRIMKRMEKLWTPVPVSGAVVILCALAIRPNKPRL